MIATLFNITVIAEFCTFFAAVYLLNKKTGIWRLFIPLLFFTICAETTGWSLSYLFNKKNNGWVFTINLLINTILLLWLFTKAAPMQRAARVIRVAICFFVLFAVCNTLFLQGFINYQTYTDVFAEFILILTSCYFFYAVLNEEEYRNIFRYEYFWLANGILLSALGSVVLYIFYNNIAEYQKETDIDIYGYINYSINVLYYGSFIISFVCRNKTTK